MKKALVFTIMAIIIITVILVYTKPISYITMENRVPVIKQRVLLANDFVKEATGSYMENIIKVALINGTHAYIKVLEQDGFAEDQIAFRNNISSIMLDGSIRKNDNKIYLYQVPYQIDTMKNTNIQKKIQQISDKIKEYQGFNSSIIASNIVVFQGNVTGPWYMGVNLTVEVEVNATVANWLQRKNITVLVPIENFEDPYFALHSPSYSSKIRKIKATNITKWDAERFEKHINLSTYRFDEEGLSYESRFYNGKNATMPCCGIESIVNKSEYFTNPPAYTLGVSFIDYCYFTAYCHGTLYKLNESGSSLRTDLSSDVNANPPTEPSYYPLRIETYHRAQYNLSYNFTYVGNSYSILVTS